MAGTSHQDLREATNVLQRVLAEVIAGRLIEGGPRGVAMRRRLEGAQLALEATGHASKSGPHRGGGDAPQ